MRGKMPKAAKIALLAVCASSLLSVACKIAPELAFMKVFPGYARGLDHKAIALAVPVARVVSSLVSGAILLMLVVALALGKSWARKSCIAMAIVKIAFSAGAVCLSVLPQLQNSFRWWNWADIAVGEIVALLVLVLLFRRDAAAWYHEDATPENKWKNRMQCLTFWGLLVVAGAVCSMVQMFAVKMANPKMISDRFPRVRVAELKARAELGDALSMWRLGNWEKNGWLGDKHPDKAVEWYRKAADLGNMFALNDLDALPKESQGENR